jgi:hypothetical protein
MNPNARGVKTTEFWMAFSSQLFAVLVLVGLVAPQDATRLQDSLSKVIAAVALIVTNACVVTQYIKGRLRLKLRSDSPATDSPPDSYGDGGGIPTVALVILFLGGWFLGPGVALGQGLPAPAPGTVRVTPATFQIGLINLGHRQQPTPAPAPAPQSDPNQLMLLQQLVTQQQQHQQLLQQQLQVLQQQLQVLQQQHTAPATPPVLIYNPPYQNLPQGAPRQELPQGPPKQDLPQGAPKQELPQGTPKQELPQGAPRQDLPGGAPKQELVPQGAPKQNLPAQEQPALQYQRYVKAVYPVRR